MLENRCHIKWGKPGKGPEPTKADVKEALATIKEKAKDVNVFCIHVTGPIYRYLKKNLKNAYVELFMSGDDVSTGPMDHAIYIGTDVDTVKARMDSI